MARYKIHIAALSETRLSGTGQLVEEKAGYTFFWSGRPLEERRQAGVGFAIKSDLVRSLVCLPTEVNDRLITLRLPLRNKRHATIISAYAPTMTNPEDTIETFYEELSKQLDSVPRTDKLILLGDFNARVGKDSDTWPGVIGRHGIGKTNSNGLLLLQTCTTYELIISNTVFRLPLRKKTTWMHPRSKHWHMIDFVITRQRDANDIRVTKAMCGAECWTDHRLVVSKMKLSIQPKRRPQGTKSNKRLNVSKLHKQNAKDNLSSELTSALQELNLNQTDVEESWSKFRDTVYQQSLSVLGQNTRKHQDWFDEHDEEIQELLTQDREAHRAHLHDPQSKDKHKAYKQIHTHLQAELRRMRDTWMSNKSLELQAYADKHDYKKFYNALKTLYGPQPSSASPLLSQDGTTLIVEKPAILCRWAEHFQAVLNRPSSVNEDAIARLPQQDINMALNAPPTEEEVHKAIKEMSSGKAPGPDALPAEIFKLECPLLKKKLTDLFAIMWSQGSIPQELKDANIIHLYKRKGNRQSCDNHRGISLLSHAGKILARVLLNRLLLHLETNLLLPESQCGFRAGRGTADMIFAVRQLQEKSQEQNRALYLTFVDLTKAFDTVCRDGLWAIMAKFGCPPLFIQMVRQFHEGMCARVSDNGELSEPFAVTNGVKQGCVLAPTFFSMVFSAMLSDAYADEEPDIIIRHRMDGSVFNLRRLQAKTKIRQQPIREFLFADVCALASSSEHAMQTSLDSFASACQHYGLTISTQKTEVLHQPAPRTQPSEPELQVDNSVLKNTDKFVYLGSTINRAVTIDDEVDLRISKASQSFGRLKTSVWDRRGLKLKTKLQVYNAAILTILLYACETWTVYQRHAKKLNRFHLNCLRKILKISWKDKVPDTDVLRKAEMTSIHTLLKKAQLRWAGHVCRMESNRLPKMLFYGELTEGKRDQGGPKKRFKDSLKASLKDFGIQPEQWESAALNRNAWKTDIRRGASAHEAKRIVDAEFKRQERKRRAAAPPSAPANPTLVCQHCGCSFRARIGLISHQRHAHRP